jgi:hypothetical protein
MDELLRNNPEIAAKMLSFLPAGTLAATRSVSKAFKHVADATPVEGGPVKMGEMTEHFAGYEPTGMHGASSKDAASLYGGVSIGHDSNYDKGSKLGPGFYMTPGSDPIEKRTAGEFATNRTHKVGGTAAIYRVLTRKLETLRKNAVQPGPWLKTNPPSKELRPDFRGGDALTSELSDMRHHGDPRSPKELKIAPHMISPTLDEGVFEQHKSLLEKDGLREELERKRKAFGLEVLPPSHPENSPQRGVLGKDFLRALEARMKKKKEAGEQ